MLSICRRHISWFFLFLFYRTITSGQIATLISAKTAAQQFIDSLCGLPQKVTAFNPETWGKLLDHATVNTDGSIRFTFRNGIEI